MTLFEKILTRKEKISVVGLGYVGFPLAAAFAKKADVIGFDIDEKKIEKYRSGFDPANEAGDSAVRYTAAEFTSDETKLRSAKFHIAAVPTPVNQNHTPDLSPVENAAAVIGRNLTEGSIVVFESTVYPGVTENICVPILEKESGLKCGAGFKVGYSPERINPGDKIHRLENIIKIVSGMDEETLCEIAGVYNLIIEAGVHKVSTIKTAEAIKVAENSQRDINIAFMNELAMVFDKMDIDTAEVADGMNTKWNALGFRPGLVGGHCIGVDPYYFIYEAEKLGYHSQIILSGRKINDSMGSFIADAVIRQLILADKKVKEAKVVIFGLTFKENCPDIRNSKVADVMKRLREYGIRPVISDPLADREDAKNEYSIDLTEFSDIKDADCVVLAVAHDEYKKLSAADLDRLFIKADNKDKIIIDVKSILDKKSILENGYRYWRL